MHCVVCVDVGVCSSRLFCNGHKKASSLPSSPLSTSLYCFVALFFGITTRCLFVFGAKANTIVCMCVCQNEMLGGTRCPAILWVLDTDTTERKGDQSVVFAAGYEIFRHTLYREEEACPHFDSALIPNWLRQSSTKSEKVCDLCPSDIHTTGFVATYKHTHTHIHSVTHVTRMHRNMTKGGKRKKQKITIYINKKNGNQTRCGSKHMWNLVREEMRGKSSMFVSNDP